LPVPCRSHCSAALLLRATCTTLQRATCTTLAACHLYDAAGCHVYDTPACHVYDAAGCHVYDAAAVGEKASCLLPAATKLYVRDFSYRAHRLQARALAALYCVYSECCGVSRQTYSSAAELKPQLRT
jgi:hypothetical protein